MANQITNFFNIRRSRTPSSPASESESPYCKRQKKLDESDEHEHQDGDVIIDALDMTEGIAETLKEILQKLRQLDSIESSVKKIEATLENLEVRTTNLENFQRKSRK